MIVGDQPTCFPGELLVRVSSRSDGMMLDRANEAHHPSVVVNRKAFCDLQQVNYKLVVYQQVIYDNDQSFDRIVEVDESDTSQYVSGIHADALVTSQRGVGLMLCLADCIGTVVYDPVYKRLALVHLGRHSTVAGLMTKVITWFIEQGSNPQDIIIWMAPSIKSASDRLEYFDYADDPIWKQYVDYRPDGIYIDMAGFNRASAERAGVLPENIFVLPIDTATHPEYFSHRHGDTRERFAVLAVIR